MAAAISDRFDMAREEALLRGRMEGLDNLVVAGTAGGEFFWSQATSDPAKVADFFDELARVASDAARLWRSAGGLN